MKSMKLLALFCLLAGLIILAAPDVRADADGDVDRAAQKLAEQEKQDKADEQAEYDRQHPKEYDSTPMGDIIGTLIVFGGGFLFVRLLWNLHKPLTTLSTLDNSPKSMSGGKSKPPRKLTHREMEIVAQISAEDQRQPSRLETQKEITERVMSSEECAYVEKLRAKVREYEKKASKQYFRKPSGLDASKSPESIQVQPEQQPRTTL